jgi:hypothetical protein
MAEIAIIIPHLFLGFPGGLLSWEYRNIHLPISLDITGAVTETASLNIVCGLFYNAISTSVCTASIGRIVG